MPENNTDHSVVPPHENPSAVGKFRHAMARVFGNRNQPSETQTEVTARQSSPDMLMGELFQEHLRAADLKHESERPKQPTEPANTSTKGYDGWVSRLEANVAKINNDARLAEVRRQLDAESRHEQGEARLRARVGVLREQNDAAEKNHSGGS